MTKCGFCGLELNNTRKNARWCSPECQNRGGQLNYLLKLKERAESNPSEFHGKYRGGSAGAAQ